VQAVQEIGHQNQKHLLNSIHGALAALHNGELDARSHEDVGAIFMMVDARIICRQGHKADALTT
jgi:hypothetical protein